MDATIFVETTHVILDDDPDYPVIFSLMDDSGSECRAYLKRNVAELFARKVLATIVDKA